MPTLNIYVITQSNLHNYHNLPIIDRQVFSKNKKASHFNKRKHILHCISSILHFQYKHWLNSKIKTSCDQIPSTVHCLLF